MDHNRFHQQVRSHQAQVQQTWDASVRRFHDQQQRHEAQQLARLYGTGDGKPTSGLAIVLQILLFLIIVAAGALFIVTKINATP